MAEEWGKTRIIDVGTADVEQLKRRLTAQHSQRFVGNLGVVEMQGRQVRELAKRIETHPRQFRIS